MPTNMVIPTRLRPSQVDHIQPSRSSTIHHNVDSTKLYVLDVPPNPVKRPEHPVFLESSHESVLPSTRMEPTESLTSVTKMTDQKNQHSTETNVEMIKTQKPQATEYRTVNRTGSKKSSIIVTRVDSSISKVTSTLRPILNNKTRSETSDLIAQVTKNIAKPTTNTVNQDESNATVQMKPKEVINVCI